MKLTVTKRNLCNHGPTVSSSELGAMRMSELYDKAERAVCVAIMHSLLNQIEHTVPPGTAAGTRYNAYLMGDLDSERA
jgi:hypothetical protein